MSFAAPLTMIQLFTFRTFTCCSEDGHTTYKANIPILTIHNKSAAN